MDGKGHGGLVMCDVRQFDAGRFAKTLGDLGLDEKPVLPSGHVSQQAVLDAVNSHFPSPEYLAWRTGSRDRVRERLGPLRSLRNLVREKGFFRAIAWAGGSGAVRCGTALKNWSHR
jgi:hypothetical protein